VSDNQLVGQMVTRLYRIAQSHNGWHLNTKLLRNRLGGLLSIFSLSTYMNTITLIIVCLIVTVAANLRLTSTIATAVCVGTVVALIGVLIDLEMMPKPLKPDDVMFYGGGTMILRWIVGFICGLVGTWGISAFRRFIVRSNKQ
jgi:hypothetical protein